jgi:SWI/SNF-related matrix-associated actin-dependent regulator of chromatin subfamily B protein 1
MNFNQLPGNSLGKGMPRQQLMNQQQQQHQQQQQQQQQQQTPQQNPQGIQIPPALLANLTPQQLQQMKNHPQFQEILRQYIQRQQMQSMQQRQAQQQAPNSQFSMPVPPGSQQIPNQVYGSQPRQPSFQGGQIPFQQGMQQALTLPQQQFPQIHQAQHQQLNQKAPQYINQQIPQQPGILTRPQQIPSVPAQQLLLRQQIEPSGRLASNMDQFGNQQSVQNSRKLSTVNDTNISAKEGLASVPSELMNRLSMPELSSTDEWSKKLMDEGKPVPIDLRIYESIAGKDFNFIQNAKTQIENNGALIDKLSKDLFAYNQIKQLRMQAIQLSSQGKLNNSIWGEGFQGYGNGITNTVTKLILPGKDLTERQINERVLKHLDKPKNFVPIRLDFDQEKDRFKLRDTFLWDLNEEVLTVESFVHQLLDDYKLIHPSNFDVIVQTVREQINDYMLPPVKTTGELRVPIKIDITINNTQLIDRFEWDILNFEENDPEEFATIMCDEFSLPGEFATAIAHLIREQSQMYHKALQLTGYNFDGSLIQEDEIRSQILPSLRLNQDSSTEDFLSILRNPTTVSEYTPSLIKLSQVEVERLDKEIERDSRRKRRHNLNEDFLASNRITTSSRRLAASYQNRGGPTIPDLSDIPKTFRTPAPSSILPGAVDLGVPPIYDYNEIHVLKRQVRNPDFKPLPPANHNNQRVKYDYDPVKEKFMVVIKLP